MKFVLAALTALLATAAAAAVPEISANSVLGKNLLHHARRLDGEEDDAEEYSWVSGYAVKFVRMGTPLSYGGGQVFWWLVKSYGGGYLGAFGCIRWHQKGV